MRKIGIDLGKARIGVALSDELGILASCYATLNSKGIEQDAQEIASLVIEKKADTVVLGLPLALDGTDSDMTTYARQFALLLEKQTDAKVVLWDERLSSYEAEEILKSRKIKDWRERKKILDQLSASIILQSYLNK